VRRGKELFDAQPEQVVFTTDPSASGGKDIAEADALLNDLDRHPHAFVLACVMNRQIKAERAWLIPYRISQALGGFSFQLLRTLSLDE
jgi:endonuclease III